ncbi:hypothetical protein [Streptomyces sp. 5-10]|uniref:hypothetical protein n=1 Tax=Streptomyces sp. 5-10 TaxID=878925 RepID=UPI00168B8FF1|nr:hypothetical protein [Streptomyces sp. 5-10]MBD3004869.1 hypothetical protein [Streptomyces sp. 5-10]
MAAKKKSKKELSEEEEARVIEKVRADLAEYRPGIWAEKVNYGPACVCGLRRDVVCHRHPVSAQKGKGKDVRGELPEFDINRGAA